MMAMAAADEAVEQMYSWIEKRELSAKTLQKLADELEALRDKCNKYEAVGSTVAVVGFTSMIIAGVATFCTGGLATPVLAVVSGAVGTALSVGAKITEHFLSSSTLKEAKKIEEECNRMAKHLQQLFEELKAQSPFTDPDQVDQYVVEKLIGAMAKRSGLPDFNASFLLDDHDFNFAGQHPHMRPRGALVMGCAVVTFMGVLCCFSFAPSGKKLNLLLAKASEKIIKKLSSMGLKTAIKAGSQIVGGAVGLIFSLPEAIESWKNLIKRNHVTEASQSLRMSAESLLKGTRTMTHQLNQLKKTFDRLKKVELCIKNPQRTRRDRMRLIQFASDLSCDVEVKRWLRKNHTSVAFFVFVDIFYLVLKMVVKSIEKLKKFKKNVTEEDEIDVVLVAHGAITDTLIPSTCLLPFRSIKDVVLYSPWNCAINSYTAYGIASGRIRPQHRRFHCSGRCSIPDSGHQPSRLPSDWNRMQDARGRLIPNIMVKPVGLADDNAWKAFNILKNVFHFPDRKRVVIPFILPGDADVAVPFFVVTLALSIVLFFTNQKATVHLSACLSKMPQDTELDVESLLSQYSYTIDETSMSCSRDMFPIEHEIMYQFLRAVFD